MRASKHAIKRYAERTARVGEFGVEDILLNEVKNGTTIDHSALATNGFVVRIDKTKTYVSWTDTRTYEPMCAVLDKDMNIVTVLTREMHAWHGYSRKQRNEINAALKRAVTDEG